VTNSLPPNGSNARRAVYLVAFMWVAYFLNYCDRQVVFALFPILTRELHLSDTQLGLTGSLFLWVYGIGGPIAGKLGDRCSKRLLVALSLAIWSVITFATGFSTSATMLLSLRAAMGMSEALYMPAAIALTANAFSAERRSRALSSLATAQIAGTIAGSWFGGWMGDQDLWRGAFISLGAVGLLYVIPYSLFLRTVSESAAMDVKALPSDSTALVRTPTFALLCVVFTIFVFGLWLIYGWLPSFLHDKFALNLEDAAFNATVYLQGSTLVGLVLGGMAADKLYA